MFENLDIFKMSSAMATHAGQKQAVVAQNVANSDTPGYVARDTPDFKASFHSSADPSQQRATRSAHLNGVLITAAKFGMMEPELEATPNGNRVSLEEEMLKSVDAKRQHDRALAIYKHAMTVLRSTSRTN